MGTFWLSQFRVTSKTARLFVPNMFIVVVPLNLPPNEVVQVDDGRRRDGMGRAGVDGVAGCIIRRPNLGC